MNKSVEKVDNSVTYRKASAVLGVFAKEPVAGQVKTRLSPPLQPEQAALLYRTALDETLKRFSDQSFELVIFYAGAEDYFSRNYPLLPRQPQSGNDLGERLANAGEHASDHCRLCTPRLQEDVARQRDVDHRCSSLWSAPRIRRERPFRVAVLTSTGGTCGSQRSMERR